MGQIFKSFKLAMLSAGLVIALAIFVQVRAQQMPGMKMPAKKTSPAVGSKRQRSTHLEPNLSVW